MDSLTTKQLEELLILKKKEYKKKNFSKLIVTLVILLNVVFTTAILYAFLKVGNEPATLIGSWFAFTTVELWSLSKIKRDKIKEENEGDDYNDR